MRPLAATLRSWCLTCIRRSEPLAWALTLNRELFVPTRDYHRCRSRCGFGPARSLALGDKKCGQLCRHVRRAACNHARKRARCFGANRSHNRFAETNRQVECHKLPCDELPECRSAARERPGHSDRSSIAPAASADNSAGADAAIISDRARRADRRPTGRKLQHACIEVARARNVGEPPSDIVRNSVAAAGSSIGHKYRSPVGLETADEYAKRRCSGIINRTTRKL
jgi:hypothetical protein